MPSRSYVPRVSSLALALAATGCSADPAATTTPTYHRDIAPLYAEHCVPCHRAGQVAPFALDSYQNAKDYAALAKHATAERAMPPFGVDASGDCGTFADPRWLSDEAIALIGRWADAGMPEGDPAEAPALDPPALPTLEGRLVSSGMREAYEPTAGEADEYRCFDAPLDLDADAFITGYEVRPGNEAIVHHVLVWTYDPDEISILAGEDNGALIADLDGADARPGWDCLGIAGQIAPSRLPALWTPGTPATRYPGGIGMPVRKGERLLFEVHYYVPAPAGSDQTEVTFEIADEVERPGDLILADGILDTLFDGDPFAIPPANEHVRFDWEGDYRYMLTPPGPPLPDDAELPPWVDVYGVFPHMHLAGSKLEASLVSSDGDDRCVADVPRWDFDWQQVFMYRDPVRLQPGDTMQVTCEYDTRGRDRPTLPGFGSEDEMCSLGIFVAFGQ